MSQVLLAGATGRLGRHVAAELRRRGHAVRALVRDPARVDVERDPVHEVVVGDLTAPASLRTCCQGVEAVVSCAGASMRLDNLRDRRGFDEVDHRGNRNLLERAQEAGVRRFVYVSVFGGRELEALEYAAAHEQFADALAGSGLSYAVVRPTGFFSFFDSMLEMAAGGRGVVLGTGEARTNPVHEADVAAACADALEGGDTEVDVGGPDVLTRREIAELAFRAVGREPALRRLPPALFRTLSAPARPVNPRLHALLSFGLAVSLVDCIAPVRGTRRLEDYFRERAPQIPRKGS